VVLTSLLGIATGVIAALAVLNPEKPMLHDL
jgi:hypothetical protein